MTTILQAKKRLANAQAIMSEIEANNGEPVYISIKAAARGKIKFVVPGSDGSAQRKFSFACDELIAAEKALAAQSVLA